MITFFDGIRSTGNTFLLVIKELFHNGFTFKLNKDKVENKEMLIGFVEEQKKII